MQNPNTTEAGKGAGYVLNDWDLTVATCHVNGTCNRILSAEDFDAVWPEGDGYGRMSLSELRALEIDGDWSHLRDASPEGHARVAAKIRERIGRRLLSVQDVVRQLGVLNR